MAPTPRCACAYSRSRAVHKFERRVAVECCMGSLPPPLSFLLMIVSGWVHRHQLLVIEFLQTENRFLKERLPGTRIRFTNAERARLAGNRKAVGRKALL